MKYLNKYLVWLLCFLMVFGTQNHLNPLKADASEKTFRTYSVPVISPDYPDGSIVIYETDGKYFLSFDDIAMLTRFQLRETETEIVLTQGVRRVCIDKSSGQLMDFEKVNQGQILLEQYRGAYFCEGIPMLRFLGAACTIQEDQALEVMMPNYTIWEAIKPNYPEYNISYMEIHGGETAAKIALTLDILSDMMNSICGHGLNLKEENLIQDSLNDILAVDMMKYNSVRELASDLNQKCNRYLEHYAEKIFFNFSTSAAGFSTERVCLYANRVLNSSGRKASRTALGKDESLIDLCFKSELESLEKSIRSDVSTSKSLKSFIEMGMVALDTAITCENLLQYDSDTRTLFTRTINDEILLDAGYPDIYWRKVSDQISENLKSKQSIVQSTVVDKISGFVGEKIREEGITLLLSQFTSAASLYTAAIQLGSAIGSLLTFRSSMAFSADLHAGILNDVQHDVSRIATELLSKTIDENRLGDGASLLKLRDMFLLYYRTTIAYADNLSKSVAEFGYGAKNRAKLTQHFGGVSGDSICNTIAGYLYMMTNCTIVPIEPYSTLSDNVLTSDWIQAYQTVDTVPIYMSFMETEGYKPYVADWFYGFPTEYAILDVDGDGLEELIVTGGNSSGFYNYAVFGYNRSSETVYAQAIHGSDKFGENGQTVAQYYNWMMYSPGHHALVYREYNNGSMFDSCGFHVINEDKLILDFALWFETDFSTNHINYGISTADGREIISKADYDSTLQECVPVEWKTIPASTLMRASTKTDLSFWFQTELMPFVEYIGDMQDARASSGIEYSNDSITVCTDDGSEIISYIALYGDCDYSIFGIEYRMPLETAAKLANAFCVSVLESWSQNMRFVTEEGYLFSLHIDGNKNVDSISLSMR